MKFEECYRGFIWADMEKFYNQEKKRPDKRIRTYTGKDGRKENGIDRKQRNDNKFRITGQD